jgi:hypothetical protein
VTQPVVPSPRLPKEQLIKLFKAISGVSVAWNTRRRPLLGHAPNNEPAWLLIGLQAWREVGVDELRYQWNPVTNANDVIIVGQRQFTVDVKAFSLSEKLEAFDLCERVRFRLRTAFARALMIPILSLRDIQPIQQPPAMEATPGGHIVLRADMDVRMNCVVGADPNDPGEGNVIESAEVEDPVIGTNLIP